MIREYDERRDEARLRGCIIELQDSERRMEPALPRGEEMADAYLRVLLDRCAERDGKVFFAEVDGEVAGFVGVMTKVRPTQPDQEQAEYAYISDLVVLPSHRRRGIGHALMAHAETFARDRGATILRISVLARNGEARALYESVGFDDYLVQMVKRL